MEFRPYLLSVFLRLDGEQTLKFDLRRKKFPQSPFWGSAFLAFGHISLSGPCGGTAVISAIFVALFAVP